MSRALFEARREVYQAMAELLQASQRDPDGWLRRDIATGKARDPELAYEMAREARDLLAEMTRRMLRAEKSLKQSDINKRMWAKRRAA